MPNRPIAWGFVVTCLVVLLGIQGGRTEGETMMKNGLSAVHFERSGGFVALGKPLAADVVFGPSSAVLRPSDGAPRPLTDREIALFERLDPARLREFAKTRQAGAAPPGLPDDYQFDVAFTFSDGDTVRLTFHGQSVAELKALPALSDLAGWIIAEIEAMWAAR